MALEDFSASPALVVAFMCKHCPFVKHILDGFGAFARDLGARNLAVVAISSNDAAAYPEDAPAEMARIAKLKGFSFPYLYYESQGVAKSYQAICTPDFFLFDRERRLAYRGQFDGSPLETRSRSRARICAPPVRRCCAASHRFRSSYRALAAASSGARSGAGLGLKVRPP